MALRYITKTTTPYTLTADDASVKYDSATPGQFYLPAIDDAVTPAANSVASGTVVRLETTAGSELSVMDTYGHAVVFLSESKHAVCAAQADGSWRAYFTPAAPAAFDASADAGTLQQILIDNGFMHAAVAS